jgi:hypothetical protein
MEEPKENMARLGFTCMASEQEFCVYGKPLDQNPCVRCESYIDGQKPPYQDHCHACDKMYSWDDCKYLGMNCTCTSTVACVNEAVLFLKEVGLTVENLQSICTE